MILCADLEPNDPARRLGGGCGKALLLVVSLIGLPDGVPAAERGSLNADPELAAYKATPATGAIEELHSRLERNEARLDYSSNHGYLPALLRELRIPASSQLLVASKTSPNKDLISPRNPRALYFNDSVSLAYVPGAPLIEIAAADPRLGTVFYTLEQSPTERVRLKRDDRCTECHTTSKTLGVPGWLVRSFLTRDDGDVDVLSGLMVTHRTPLADRWGGHYVSGELGGQRHRGNRFGPEAGGRSRPIADVTDLASLLNIARFPEPSSDVVALMVLDHQAHMINLLTRLRVETESLGEGESNSRTDLASEDVLKYLLFADEARFAGVIRGSSTFAREFEALGPVDSKGRSLRQFDLRRRLFKHPCSFMIYSPSFEALPLRAKRHLYRRLFEVLTQNPPDERFGYLGPETRDTLRGILTETRKDLPAYWNL